MNSITESNYAWCSGPWFAGRHYAIQNGYVHFFVKELDGRFRCLSNPKKYFKKGELIIYKKVYQHLHLTLLLITTKDGNYKGTLIEYINRY